MQAGTTSNPRFILVHEVTQSLFPVLVANLPAFPAVTGCDTTSQFSGHGKTLAWTTYTSHLHLFDSLGDNSEVFVIKLYDPTSHATSVNELRAEMFHHVDNPEKFPPKTIL
ncbi:putative UDP-N-acetylglucosamine/UDP-glucose/GDP-mannose transporter-like 3 [Homarus americanus]|uniref:Putative UDP-N-acetylglucosamine/UDP-glucose/GDP-mannose transporter-like 3 n=1 Tax=Homarus americanus TaxID=6706 RepID=A0A8J5JS95_HOMAM|nr:putative UDP-N-acetylglucosamine/UDP-glucose/GDP-mannose transporter-like 3 [Homarus americanus]